MNADSRLRCDFKLRSDSRLQSRYDCKLQITASGVTLDSKLQSNSRHYKLRCDFRLRSESELQTPECIHITESGVHQVSTLNISDCFSTPDPGVTPDSGLRYECRLQAPACLQTPVDSRLQTRNDCKLQTTASGVTPDYKFRSDYKLRRDSNLQTPE